MTYRPQRIEQADRDALNKRWDLMPTDNAWGRGYIGPQLDVVNRDPVLKNYLNPGTVVTEADQANGSAFGSLGTVWFLDGPDVGIWGVNVTSNEDIKQAQAAGSHVPTGYLKKLGHRIPPYNELKDYITRDGWFQPGFADAYLRIYNKAAIEAAAQPKIPLRAKELSVNGNSIWVANTDSESKEDNPLNPHPGVSILGTGAWEQYAEPDEPAAHGLKYPLLAFDASTGKVAPAKVEYDSVLAAAKAGDPAAVQAFQALSLPIS